MVLFLYLLNFFCRLHERIHFPPIPDPRGHWPPESLGSSPPLSIVKDSKYRSNLLHVESFTFSKVKSPSRVSLFTTLWTVAHQAPPSIGFSRQEYWSGQPFSSPGDLPNPGIEPRFPALQEDSLPAELMDNSTAISDSGSTFFSLFHFQ